MSRFWLVSSFLCLVLLGPAWAESVFVGNKPYKGQIRGGGQELRFSVRELGQALGLNVVRTAEGWFLAGEKLLVTEDGGEAWIGLANLPPEAVKVVRNKQMGTLDLYRVESSLSSSAPGGLWGGAGTLVFFGSSRDALTKRMLAPIGEIERARSVRVVFVDVEDSARTPYDYLFAGDRVPYFVLLDGSGVKKRSFVGVHSLDEIQTILRQELR